jgi:hypothetical protein
LALIYHAEEFSIKYTKIDLFFGFTRNQVLVACQHVVQVGRYPLKKDVEDLTRSIDLGF